MVFLHEITHRSQPEKSQYGVMTTRKIPNFRFLVLLLSLGSSLFLLSVESNLGKWSIQLVVLFFLAYNSNKIKIEVLYLAICGTVGGKVLPCMNSKGRLLIYKTHRTSYLIIKWTNTLTISKNWSLQLWILSCGDEISLLEIFCLNIFCGLGTSATLSPISICIVFLKYPQ